LFIEKVKMSEYRVERRQDSDKPDEWKLRKLMEREGYLVYQWSDRPGAVYEAHSHTTDQSHWIISGVLEITVKDIGIVTLQPGDRDFMPAGTIHSARVVGSEPVVYLIGEK
jgi:mannose-6-phosphate isomerase-like protein (cupin superfamily)